MIFFLKKRQRYQVRFFLKNTNKRNVHVDFIIFCKLDIKFQGIY